MTRITHVNKHRNQLVIRVEVLDVVCKVFLNNSQMELSREMDGIS